MPVSQPPGASLSGLRTDVHLRQFITARVVRVRRGKAHCTLKIYNGALVHLPMIGVPLVLLTEDCRQLVTSIVAEIHEGDGSMRVKTRNSEYRIEFVMGAG